MCTHICGVRKRYSIPSAEQMTSTGWIMQSGNGRWWAILQHVVLSVGFILQQLRRIHSRKKYINRAKLTAHILSVASFTSGMWIWIFFKGIYVQQCKRYPLLFSGPKDNNDFSHCSFMNSPLLPPPPFVPCPLQVSNLWTWTLRDAFLQDYFLLLLT